MNVQCVGRCVPRMAKNMYFEKVRQGVPTAVACSDDAPRARGVGGCRRHCGSAAMSSQLMHIAWVVYNVYFLDSAPARGVPGCPDTLDFKDFQQAAADPCRPAKLVTIIISF